jgi:hypothetical protein
MIEGKKLRNLFRWPSLRLKAEKWKIRSVFSAAPALITANRG